MQIILLREKRGRALSQRVSRPVFVLSLLVVALGLVGNALLAAAWWGGHGPGVDTVAGWQTRIRAHRAEVESLRKQNREEFEAVGRRLAAMQARLLRMEALGQRVTEVVNLDEGEFDFSAPPAQGGPESGPEAALGRDELLLAMDQLDDHLRVREVELEMLERMLATRRFHEEVAIAGRPIDRGWMSSAFGRRVDPITGRLAWHAGVDFAGKQGSNVRALAAGVVVFAGRRKGYGQMVEIDHGGGYVTRYGHHASLLVGAGDLVKKGQVIGLMGSTGRSTGPHVHLEVLKDGRQVDPARYVARVARR
jgi:murein DD-endopeptidase MepM/ murein hydrolase activator NlpD